MSQCLWATLEWEQVCFFCPFPSETWLRLGQLPLGIKKYKPMQDISTLPLIKCLVLKGSFVFFFLI